MPLFSILFFAAAIHAVLLRFSEDPHILTELVHLDGDGVRENAGLLNRVRSAVWGMLYADDAGIASKSAEGRTKMMTVIVNVFKAADRNHAAADTEEGTPYLAARYRSSRSQV